MGGIGSGRQYYSGAKSTTDDYRSLDIRRWHREGLLASNRIFVWQWLRNGEVISSIQVLSQSPERVLLIYRHRERGGDWEHKSYPVQLSWTPCNFGEERPWFLCPARECRRRVAILYADSIFACRNCLELAYPSQRETFEDRAARRANRIRKRLDWAPGILNGSEITNKPKGMHWRTFSKLVKKHDNFVEESLAGMARRFGLRL